MGIFNKISKTTKLPKIKSDSQKKFGIFNKVSKITELAGTDSSSQRKFKISNQGIGQRTSFKSKLLSLSKHSPSFKNLNKQNIKTITTALKPYEKYIRGMKGTKGIGGLNWKQIKTIRHGLYKEFLNTRGQGTNSFTKQDYNDAMKMLKEFSMANRMEEEQQDRGLTNRAGIRSVSELNKNKKRSALSSAGSVSINSAMKKQNDTGLVSPTKNSGFSQPPKLVV